MLNLLVPFLTLAVLPAAWLARPLQKSRLLPIPIALITLGGVRGAVAIAPD